MDGAIVLVTRGACSFVEKAANVATGGAVGMVVINQVEGQVAFAMGYDQQADVDAVNIIALMVSREAGLELQGTVKHHELHRRQTYITIVAQAQSDNTASTGPAIQEQHVVVPEATQRWLQSHEVLGRSTLQDGTSPTWQSLLMELATQTLQQSTSLLQGKAAQCVGPT